MADDRSGPVLAVAVCFSVLSWLSVGLRIYVRAVKIGKFGWDDKTLVIAQIFFTAYLVSQFGGYIYGTGRHLSDLNHDRAEIALHFWFFCEVWYALASSTIKVSICLSLRRVTDKFIHIVIIYGLIIWSIALGFAFLFGVIFQCIPASDWWSLDPNQKHCYTSHVITSLTYAVSALNVMCDWTLGIFPFFIVRNLAIPLYQKVLVTGILALGALGSTATIVRMFYVKYLAESYLGDNGDFLYDTQPVAVWTTVEIGIAIVAICIATLRPLVNKAFGLSSSYYTGSEHRSRGFSPYSSANRNSPLPFGDIRSSRANAMAIIDADDAADYPQEPPAVGFSQFNTTKAVTSRLREVDDEYLEMGSNVKRHDFT